jgi:P-type Cu+ transporter
MGDVIQKTTCFHCGEDCLEDTIVFQEKQFYCQGCKTVFELLNDTGLATYYDLETSPGKSSKKEESHAYLDIESVANNWIEFKEGNQNRVTFHLPAIHCSACVWLLERLGKLKPGIIKSEVNFIRKELTILFDSDKISLKELVLLLELIGYVPDLQQKKQAKNDTDKTLILKLGIAGFAFGNIMLFSFPEYLSIDTASLVEFQQLFRYLSLALSLPVILYSGSDYLTSAWKTIRVKFLSIDVPIAIGIITLFVRSVFEVV